MCWNIYGLMQDKLNGEILGDLFMKYDMILLNETWASEQEILLFTRKVWLLQLPL